MLKFLSRRQPSPTAELRPFDLADLTGRSRQENEAIIRALCTNAYIEAGTSLCRVLGRYKMYVDTHDVSIAAHLMIDGYWEMWLTEALAKVVKPGMTVLDIGANLGYFTVLLADLVGPEGHVHAFEPNPGVFDRMRKSVLVNGFAARVTLYADPLGDTDGAEVILSWDPEQPGGAYVHAGDHPPQHGLLPLVTRRLDGIPALLDADVIKIDAEAAEQAIWRGADGLLARARAMTVFMEFTACRYPDPATFIDEIAAQGFTFALLDLESGVRPMTKSAVLALPPLEEQMLVLTRG